MQFIKMIFGKIGAGLLYGIGFGLVMFLFVWGSTMYFERNVENYMSGDVEKGECKNYKKCDKNSGLELNISSERINGDEFILLGQIKNSGDIKWTSVKVKAELFDTENNFIDQCSEYIDQKVSPGTSINFKLACAQCSKINLKNYHSYKVSIIDANTY